jgi:hypothetical protein
MMRVRPIEPPCSGPRRIGWPACAADAPSAELDLRPETGRLAPPWLKPHMAR